MAYREAVLEGAGSGRRPAGAQIAIYTVHSAEVSASNLRRCRDSAAALPSSAAATTLFCRGR